MALKPFNSMKNLVHNAGYFNAKKFEEWIVKSLADEGERIINKAYETRGFTNRTGNLHDSYVSAVFLHGRLQEKTIRFVGKEMSSQSREYSGSEVGGETEATTGREEARKFLAKYQFSKGRQGGIVLIVAAAMFYSNILDSGVGRLKRKYQVISQIQGELDKLTRGGYNVTKFNAHIKPQYIDAHTIYRQDGTGAMKVINNG